MVVAVAAVDTIFVETQIRAGVFGEHFTVQPPYVPGGGIAGTVRAVGEGVDEVWLGRRVITSLGPTGGYAEQAVASAARLVAIPDGLGLTEAAALVHDGVTATALLESTDLAAGERVLILGASGGMGTLLVQLAKAVGAQVVGVARGEAKVSLVRELGADAVVDAAGDDWVGRARTALGRVLEVAPSARVRQRERVRLMVVSLERTLDELLAGAQPCGALPDPVSRLGGEVPFPGVNTVAPLAWL